MGIKANFTAADVHQMTQEKLQKINDAILFRLKELGDRCVNQARDFGDYTDQSTNLRSSVGYIILADGEVVQSDFRKSGIVRKPEKGDGSEGLEKARSFAMSLAGNYPKGCVLIVVAGMNYAAYVETRRNVLSSAEHLAQTELPKLLSQLKRKVEA